MDQIQCVWPKNLLVWASWLSNDNGIHFAGWRRLSPTTTRDRLGADFMLAHRHQRWPNIYPISGQLVTFAGISTGDVWTAELTDRDDSFLWPGDYLTMSMLIVPAEHQQSTSLPRDTHPMLSINPTSDHVFCQQGTRSTVNTLSTSSCEWTRLHTGLFLPGSLWKTLVGPLVQRFSVSLGAALKAVLKTTVHRLLRLMLSGAKLLYNNILWEMLVGIRFFYVFIGFKIGQNDKKKLNLFVRELRINTTVWPEDSSMLRARLKNSPEQTTKVYTCMNYLNLLLFEWLGFLSRRLYSVSHILSCTMAIEYLIIKFSP